MNKGLRDKPTSRVSTNEYRENYDIIFNRKSDKKAGILKKNTANKERSKSEFS